MGWSRGWTRGDMERNVKSEEFVRAAEKDQKGLALRKRSSSVIDRRTREGGRPSISRITKTWV